MKTSEQTDKIFPALVAMQSMLGNVKKEKTAKAGKYDYDYASIDDVCRHVREPMSRQGLAHAQGADENGIITTIVHDSGQWVEHYMRWTMNPTGGPQAEGGNVTFARRYALLAALGIAASGDDDDAAMAQRVHDYAQGIGGKACMEALQHRGCPDELARKIIAQFKADHPAPSAGDRLNFLRDCQRWQPAEEDPALNGDK